MSEASGCSGNCSSCSSKGSCSKPQSLLEPANHLSEVKKVIGIVSGKGGVGKSMVTSSLAVMMQRRGFSTAILDADITGPSIPKMFGITGRAQGTELGIDPRLSCLLTCCWKTPTTRSSGEDRSLQEPLSSSGAM